ncbi:metalloendopeptidase [Amycolatopsis antarctica]|uniref:Metalloendopeptidase n=1 Tax=Amycolatopsis antarctica TaxID=1854586 RepID=A0A263D137_9PSEU|nr:M23 family metallopeptidase [Amycolatopsis antarctica]OZM72051.1 metalloendopeptidase [Amycolatopsis antarctica]
MTATQTQRPPAWFVCASRIRGAGLAIGLTLLAVSVLGSVLLPRDVLPAAAVATGTTTGVALLVAGMVLTLLPYRPTIAPRPVRVPATGRWLAANSPESGVPSHGTHSLGQSFAIDLVYAPEDGSRPEFGSGPAFRDPGDYPAFGRPLLAPCAGTVVRTHDSARDHRARSGNAAVAYMMVEGMVRELLGTRRVVGNHVLLDVGDGVYAVLAHLRRGSVAVRAGDRVEAGQVLGECGNSGNSSEPHLHFHLMDSPHTWLSAGLPFVFTDVSIDGGELRDGIPATDSTMTGTP